MYRSKIKRISFWPLLGLLACKCHSGNVQMVETKNNDSLPATKNLILPVSGKKGFIRNLKKMCLFLPPGTAGDSAIKDSYELEPCNSKELSEISSITDYVGITPNFAIYNANVPNALATVIDNQRVILYKKDFVDRNDRHTKSYWASMFILAHEIGHHLCNHLADTSAANNIKYELEADRFAGATLFRLGASEKEATSVMDLGYLSQINNSITHPNDSMRIAKILEGYEQASFALNYKSAIPPSPDDDPSPDAKTEFSLKDFSDPTLIHLLPIYKESPEQMYQGVIVVSQRPTDKDPDGEDNLVVQLTESPRNEIGQRMLLIPPALGELTRWDYENFATILKRGQKIRFKAFFYKGYYLIYYLKWIPRKD